MEHEVIEFEIVVDEGGGGFGGKVVLEVGDDRVHSGEFGGAGAVPAVGPAADLAFDEADGFAEGEEGGVSEGDGVELDEAVEEGLADGGSLVGPGGGEGGTDDDAAAAFHEVEGGAQDGGIFAKAKGFGSGGEVGMDGGEESELAGHIVGFGRDGAEGGAAEDEFFGACGEEIREIGVAAGELGNGEVRQLEPGGEGGEGEFFAGANGGGIDHEVR